MESNAGCGCQHDASGRVFVDHCVCPDRQPAVSALANLRAELDAGQQPLADTGTYDSAHLADQPGAYYTGDPYEQELALSSTTRNRGD